MAGRYPVGAPRFPSVFQHPHIQFQPMPIPNNGPLHSMVLVPSGSDMAVRPDGNGYIVSQGGTQISIQPMQHNGQPWRDNAPNFTQQQQQRITTIETPFYVLPMNRQKQVQCTNCCQLVQVSQHWPQQQLQPPYPQQPPQQPWTPQPRPAFASFECTQSGNWYTVYKHTDFPQDFYMKYGPP